MGDGVTWGKELHGGRSYMGEGVTWGRSYMGKELHGRRSYMAENNLRRRPASALGRSIPGQGVRRQNPPALTRGTPKENTWEGRQCPYGCLHIPPPPKKAQKNPVRGVFHKKWPKNGVFWHFSTHKPIHISKAEEKLSSNIQKKVFNFSTIKISRSIKKSRRPKLGGYPQNPRVKPA